MDLGAGELESHSRAVYAGGALSWPFSKHGSAFIGAFTISCGPRHSRASPPILALGAILCLFVCFFSPLLLCTTLHWIPLPLISEGWGVRGPSARFSSSGSTSLTPQVISAEMKYQPNFLHRPLGPLLSCCPTMGRQCHLHCGGPPRRFCAPTLADQACGTPAQPSPGSSPLSHLCKWPPCHLLFRSKF